jgi:hypothetical protein
VTKVAAVSLAKIVRFPADGAATIVLLLASVEAYSGDVTLKEKKHLSIG